MNIFTSNSSKKKGKKTKNESGYFLQSLVSNNYNIRFWVTVIILITFLLLVLGIGYAMYSNTPISKDWKELLLLMLGAFISSFSEVIKFWFAKDETQKEILKMAEREDDKANESNDGDDKQLLKG